MTKISGMSEVYLKSCYEYDFTAVDKAMQECFHFIPVATKKKIQGNQVFIKVNLTGPFSPESAAITHPIVVKAIINNIKKLGGNPIICEASGEISLTQEAFKTSGMLQLSEEENVPLVSLAEGGYIPVDIPEGKHRKRIYYSKLIYESDVLISVPKLKTHVLTYFTGAIKNMYGCLPRKERMDCHLINTDNGFNEVLLDVFSVRKPDFSIVDGIVGMEGLGPAHGRPVTSGFIAISNDSVALDTISAHLMGFDVKDLYLLTNAQERNLGISDLNNIQVKGEALQDKRIVYKQMEFDNYEKRTSLNSRLTPGFTKKVLPHLAEEKCVQCGICSDRCPTQAINMNGYPEVVYDQCIQCFCCNELCPEGAMEIIKV